MTKFNLLSVFVDLVRNCSHLRRYTEIEVRPQNASASRCFQPSIGRVDIWIGVQNETVGSLYKAALQTMKCYANRVGYNLHIVDLTNDALVTKYCKNYGVVFVVHCFYVCSIFLGHILSASLCFVSLHARTSGSQMVFGIGCRYYGCQSR
jgi:hypothetical protein